MNRRSLLMIFLAGSLILSAGIAFGIQLYEFSLTRERQEMCGTCVDPDQSKSPVRCEDEESSRTDFPEVSRGVSYLLEISLEAGSKVIRCEQ